MSASWVAIGSAIFVTLKPAAATRTPSSESSPCDHLLVEPAEPREDLGADEHDSAQRAEVREIAGR
jgi:hypothetical protein